MDKTLVTSLSALGTTTVAVPATVLAGSGVEPIKPKEEFKKPKWKGKTIPFLNSTDVKSNYGKVNCLSVFAGKDNKWSEENLKKNTDPSSFLDSSDKGLGTSSATGCLLVEYHKQNRGGGTWEGSFKLVWSILSNKDGLITVINADTNEGKLIVDSSIYIMSKDNDNSWFPTYTKENIEKTIVTGDELSSYLPQPGVQIAGEAATNYWGFKPEIEKICKGKGCQGIPEDSSATKKYSYTWNGYKEASTGQPVTNWTANFNNWFDGLFGSGWSKVKEVIGKLKGDNWIKKN